MDTILAGRPSVVASNWKWDSFADWPAGRTLDNVAYAFARLLALPHYGWLRWRDDMSNDIECLQKVRSRSGSGADLTLLT